jgi:hypothetical protein
MFEKPDSPDQPLLDTAEYGSGRDDSISDAIENAAVTYAIMNVSGQGSGSYTCPNGLVAGPGNPICFTASKKDAVVTGTWSLGGGAEASFVA